MADDTEYISSTTLMILRDDIDPDTITKELEMFPDQKWKKGEIKSYRKKDGTKVQFESEHEWAGWKRFIDPAYIYQKLQSLELLQHISLF